MYGSSLFLPYSVGCLEAYARSQKDIELVFEFKGYIYRREPIVNVINRIKQSGGVDVLGISCYIWNEQYSRALADAVHSRYPRSLIVIGGPQITTRENPFLTWGSADIVVRGEGEYTFAAILRAYAGFRYDNQYQTTVFHGDRTCGTYGAISGLAIQDRRPDNQSGYITTGEPERITDLSTLPSPYLTGCFDEIIGDTTTKWKKGPQPGEIDYQVSFESDRGCMYSCSFCQWGPQALAKFYQFPMERVIAEMQWCGEHKIRYVYGCHANFGIVKQDLDIAYLLVETKKIYDFPKEARFCTAKNSNDRVFEISKLLNEAGMSKGATLSFQSMDAHTLKLIKRTNMKIDDLRKHLKRYYEHGIVTYTELIMGLPGETLESFRAGIDTLLDAGKHEGLNIYLCQVLPQTDFDDQAYQEAHEIVARRSPLLMQHSAPVTDPHQEYNDIIISTATMDAEAWCETYKFAWAVQTFHCLGLARFLAMFCRHELGMPYSEFYSSLLVWLSEHLDSYLGKEYLTMARVLNMGMCGGDWGQVDERFGNIIWPTEEMSFLRLIVDIDSVEGELRNFIMLLLANRNYHITTSLLNALVAYQAKMLIRPDDKKGWIIEMCYNCHSYFTSILLDKPIKFESLNESMLITPKRSYNSLEEYAREQVWYGRKGKRFTQSDVICYSKE